MLNEGTLTVDCSRYWDTKGDLICAEDRIVFPLSSLYGPPEVSSYSGDQFTSASTTVTVKSAGGSTFTVTGRLFARDKFKQSATYNGEAVPDPGDMDMATAKSWVHQQSAKAKQAKDFVFQISDADWANRFAKAIAQLVKLRGGKSDDLFK